KVMSYLSTTRNIFIVQITKGSPNFTLDHCGPIGFEGLNDKSKTQLTNAMELGTIAGINTALSYTAHSQPTLAVDESTNGTLNSICVAWDRTAAKLHISDLFWSKIA